MEASVVTAPVELRHPAVTARQPQALTRRASLNAGAALLDYTAKIVMGLIVTPILVSALGRSLFGVWEMLGRMASYMSATDGKPTEALRLVIAQRQTEDDHTESRRYVGAALVVWLLVLPLVAAAGTALIWVAPGLTKVPSGLAGDVRITTAVLVMNFLLGSLVSVPESVLRGMNLSYKRMGVQAALNLVGGGLAVVAVTAGLGIIGLSAAQTIRALATGLCFLLLVRTYVAWFGWARPNKREVKSLFGMSVWLWAGDIVAKLLLASDVIVLGAVVTPALVTTYVLTGYAARVTLGIHVFATSAAIPGLGGVLGCGQLERAANARRELLILTWLFVTVVGTVILAWNPSFLARWVGSEHYAGHVVGFLVVLIAAQTAFIRVDAYIIDAALRPKLRVVVGAVTAAVTVGLIVALTYAAGVAGLCLGLLTGRAIQSIAYPIMARRCLGPLDRGTIAWPEAARLVLVTATFFLAATAVGAHLSPRGWWTWIAGAGASVPLVFALALLAGPGPDTRAMLLRRIRAIGLRRRP